MSVCSCSRLLAVAGTVGVLAMAACAGGPRTRAVKMGPVDTGAGSLTAARQYLQGRWTLESFEMSPPGKAPIQLKGSGMLLYDEFGNMRMEIRTDEQSSDLLRASGIDIKDGVISTDGRTAIDMQNRTLTYVIKDQNPLIPGPLATSRPRHWEVTENELTLTTLDDAGKPLSISRWRRTQ